MRMEIIRISEHGELAAEAAAWFHSKWGIPLAAYQESMAECLAGGAVPEWYLAREGEAILGGCGVIENDFHERKDLRPNVCAVFVEPEHRCRGIAGALLDFVCRDYHRRGIDTLYLLTDHEHFYERYGWEFFCHALGDGEETPSRLYRRLWRPDADREMDGYQLKSKP